MVFSLPDFPTSITLQPISDLMPLMEVCLNPGLFCLVLSTGLQSVRQKNSYPLFTAPHPTLAPAINTYTLVTSSPSPTVPFFPITYQYHIRHSSPHMQLILLPYMVLECRHNIQNQTATTAKPSPRSIRNITTIGKHQHLGEILKYVFSYVF